jgi:adenosylcobinamide-GDP ribazoletransferase
MLSLTLVVSVAVFSWVCRKKIGGATGDTLGAVCEITETMVLIAFCTNL